MNSTLLPSEVARLVLGYLEQVSDVCSGAFLNHSPHLQEYHALLQQGRKPKTKIDGLCLTEILDEWCQVKALVESLIQCLSERERKKVTSPRLVRQLEEYIRLIKSELPARPRPLPFRRLAIAGRSAAHAQGAATRQVLPKEISVIYVPQQQAVHTVPPPRLDHATAKTEVGQQVSLPVSIAVRGKKIGGKTIATGGTEANISAVREEPDSTSQKPGTAPLQTEVSPVAEAASEDPSAVDTEEAMQVIKDTFLQSRDLQALLAENINRALAEQQCSGPSGAGDDSANRESERLLDHQKLQDIIHQTESNPVFEDFLAEVFDDVGLFGGENQPDVTASSPPSPDLPATLPRVSPPPTSPSHDPASSPRPSSPSVLSEPPALALPPSLAPSPPPCPSPSPHTPLPNSSPQRASTPPPVSLPRTSPPSSVPQCVHKSRRRKQTENRRKGRGKKRVEQKEEEELQTSLDSQNQEAIMRIVQVCGEKDDAAGGPSTPARSVLVTPTRSFFGLPRPHSTPFGSSVGMSTPSISDISGPSGSNTLLTPSDGTVDPCAVSTPLMSSGAGTLSGAASGGSTLTLVPTSGSLVAESSSPAQVSSSVIMSNVVPFPGSSPVVVLSNSMPIMSMVGKTMTQTSPTHRTPIVSSCVGGTQNSAVTVSPVGEVLQLSPRLGNSVGSENHAALIPIGDDTATPVSDRYIIPDVNPPSDLNTPADGLNIPEQYGINRVQVQADLRLPTYTVSNTGVPPGLLGSPTVMVLQPYSEHDKRLPILPEGLQSVAEGLLQLGETNKLKKQRPKRTLRPRPIKPALSTSSTSDASNAPVTASITLTAPEQHTSGDAASQQSNVASTDSQPSTSGLLAAQQSNSSASDPVPIEDIFSNNSHFSETSEPQLQVDTDISATDTSVPEDKNASHASQPSTGGKNLRGFSSVLRMTLDTYACINKPGSDEKNTSVPPPPVMETPDAFSFAPPQRLTQSTPRQKMSHVRCLDFSTPPRDDLPARPVPRSVGQKPFPLTKWCISNARVGLFKSPAEPSAGQIKVRLPKSVNTPEATSEVWDQVGAGMIFETGRKNKSGASRSLFSPEDNEKTGPKSTGRQRGKESQGNPDGPANKSLLASSSAAVRKSRAMQWDASLRSVLPSIPEASKSTRKRVRSKKSKTAKMEAFKKKAEAVKARKRRKSAKSNNDSDGSDAEVPAKPAAAPKRTKPQAKTRAQVSESDTSGNSENKSAEDKELEDMAQQVDSLLTDSNPTTPGNPMPPTTPAHPTTPGNSMPSLPATPAVKTSPPCLPGKPNTPESSPANVATEPNRDVTFDVPPTPGDPNVPVCHIPDDPGGSPAMDLTTPRKELYDFLCPLGTMSVLKTPQTPDISVFNLLESPAYRSNNPYTPKNCSPKGPPPTPGCNISPSNFRPSSSVNTISPTQLVVSSLRKSGGALDLTTNSPKKTDNPTVSERLEEVNDDSDRESGESETSDLVDVEEVREACESPTESLRLRYSPDHTSSEASLMHIAPSKDAQLVPKSFKKLSSLFSPVPGRSESLVNSPINSAFSPPSPPMHSPNVSPHSKTAPKTSTVKPLPKNKSTKGAKANTSKAVKKPPKKKRTKESISSHEIGYKTYNTRSKSYASQDEVTTVEIELEYQEVPACDTLKRKRTESASSDSPVVRTKRRRSQVLAESPQPPTPEQAADTISSADLPVDAPEPEPEPAEGIDVSDQMESTSVACTSLTPVPNVTSVTVSETPTQSLESQTSCRVTQLSTTQWSDKSKRAVKQPPSKFAIGGDDNCRCRLSITPFKLLLSLGDVTVGTPGDDPRLSKGGPKSKQLEPHHQKSASVITKTHLDTGLSMPPPVISLVTSPLERSVTPSPLERSVTPSPLERSVTPSPLERSVTPAPLERSATPAPLERSVTPSPSANSSMTPVHLDDGLMNYAIIGSERVELEEPSDQILRLCLTNGISVKTTAPQVYPDSEKGGTHVSKASEKEVTKLPPKKRKSVEEVAQSEQRQGDQQRLLQHVNVEEFLSRIHGKE